MSRLSILVRALPRNRLGNISKKVYGSSLANTVHQNYALGVKKLKDQLDAKGGQTSKHRSIAECDARIGVCRALGRNRSREGDEAAIRNTVIVQV